MIVLFPDTHLPCGHDFYMPSGLARDILAQLNFEDKLNIICPAAIKKFEGHDVEAIRMALPTRLGLHPVPRTPS
jgi:hypothetical protein